MGNRSFIGKSCRWLVFLFFGGCVSHALAYDTDLDSIDDQADNCLLIKNNQQADVDNDGFGNRCDGDFNNDNLTNFIDFALMTDRFYESAPFSDGLGVAVDMNSDGQINFLDLALFSEEFLTKPGPSGASTAFTDDDASRFLAQTTFGPTMAEIQSLTEPADIEAWLDNQLTMPKTSHEERTRQLTVQMCYGVNGNPSMDGYYRPARTTAWWQISLTGADQLRQRVAFALSQILVIGDHNDILRGSQYAVANYYDELAEHAFGNYRDLLEVVSKHAMMGTFLSHVRNQRPQPEINIRPDENYARELLQLFTLGVHQLNIDGSKILDSNGNPIPTYTQEDIEQFSRVFTGWNYAGVNWGQYWGEADRVSPMVAFEEFHDVEEKTLLFGQVTPAGQTAQQDLDVALDNIFGHPNIGPFVSRQLIQRLVTSNPTSGYIERVAQVFHDNGNGVRGDLKAVIRTILLDAEARYGHLYLGDEFGKLREPLIRLAQVRRAFNAEPNLRTGFYYNPSIQCGEPAYEDYRIPFGTSYATLAQQALSSPSVFNFFQPNYAPPGPIRSGGLVAPEFQLFTTSQSQSAGKAISFEIQNNQIHGSDWVELSLQSEISLAESPDALVNYLDTLLVSGQLSAGSRADILSHLDDESMPTDSTRNEVRARDAIMLVVMSPDYLIQR